MLNCYDSIVENDVILSITLLQPFSRNISMHCRIGIDGFGNYGYITSGSCELCYQGYRRQDQPASSMLNLTLIWLF